MKELNPLEIRELLQKHLGGDVNIDKVSIDIEYTPIKMVERIAFECVVFNEEKMVPVTAKQVIESTAKMFREGRQAELYPYLPITSVCPMFVKNSERDWPEDFEDENGNYQNRCCVCKEFFFGYKRRVTCKKCKSKTTYPFVEI